MKIKEILSKRSDTWQEIKPMFSKPIPAATVKAYRDRLEARRATDAAQRAAPIVWQGAFDDTYRQAMAMLDADGAKLSTFQTRPMASQSKRLKIF